ncbi:acetyl-CoA carboxylase biotin carboxylase subunit [bacterium]|nr:acetyl-CoA carboxylase biotin carboxylase subunit [bacterium]
MFKKVLIANRGEIAVRVSQTLQEMGIAALAVYSDADRKALHVMRADEAVPLAGTAPAETYLNQAKLIGIARKAGADAVHPGYGFLSENASFARACREAGLVFIGPQPEVIEAMGDKIRAKALMTEAGVPVVPGWKGDTTDAAALTKAAAKIGYPVLLKAAAGGGGKGMRIVRNEAGLAEAQAAAAREAEKAFGDARIFVEKYIDRPRHVEFQIFGDKHGNCVQLFERECSIQRRYQKIIEESPSPALTPALRTAMGKAALAAARALNYEGAGTVEFMLAPDGKFYFLEVNTRLQVEHPVTELVLGLDLVRAQILVAAGEPLPFAQEELRQRGHAIECRLYAEDPARSFLPSTGRLVQFSTPRGAHVRVDVGVRRGSEVSVHYDPMLAKLVVWGEDREQARQRMAWALRRFAVLGVSTNIEFLGRVVEHPAFAAGELHTHFLDEHAIDLKAPARLEAAVAIAAGLAAAAPAGEPKTLATAAAAGGPWKSGQRWRNS